MATTLQIMLFLFLWTTSATWGLNMTIGDLLNANTSEEFMRKPKDKCYNPKGIGGSYDVMNNNDQRYSYGDLYSRSLTMQESFYSYCVCPYCEPKRVHYMLASTPDAPYPSCLDSYVHLEITAESLKPAIDAAVEIAKNVDGAAAYHVVSKGLEWAAGLRSQEPVLYMPAPDWDDQIYRNSKLQAQTAMRTKMSMLDIKVEGRGVQVRRKPMSKEIVFIACITGGIDHMSYNTIVTSEIRSQWRTLPITKHSYLCLVTSSPIIYEYPLCIDCIGRTPGASYPGPFGLGYILVFRKMTSTIEKMTERNDFDVHLSQSRAAGVTRDKAEKMGEWWIKFGWKIMPSEKDNRKDEEGSDL